MPREGWTVVAPHTLGLMALTLVASTLSLFAVGGPHAFDAGELVAAAFALGGSHPPGQPLHAIVGHAAAFLPIGPVTFRVTLISVIGVCSAAYFAGRLAYVFSASDGPTGRVVAGAAAAAVLTCAPVARQATRPEVYGLALGLTLYAIHGIVTFAQRRRPAGLRCAALATGLTATLHPPHALIAALVGVLWLAVARPDRRFAHRTLINAALLGLLPVALVTVYLPLRARAGATTWGDPTTLAGLLDYVTGKAYSTNVGGSMVSSAMGALAHLAVTAGVAAAVGVFLWVRAHYRRSERRQVVLPLATLVVSLTGAALIPTEVRNPDAVAYLAPATALAVALGAAGLLTLRSRLRWVGTLLLVVLVIHPERNGIALMSRDEPALETFTHTLSTTPPSRALLITETDFVAGALMLTRHVGGARPDLAVLMTGLSSSSWHWPTLRAHPLFDGNPPRPAGPRGHGRYVYGAINQVDARVAVALEPDWPTSGRGDLAGPYLLLRPERRSAEPPPALPIAPAVDAARADTPRAILRHALVTGARRALSRGRIDETRRAMTAAVTDLPAATREAVGHIAAPTRPTPRAVRDPNAYLLSSEDAARELSRMLFAGGDEARAMTVLEAQLARGDGRALLQLAWLHMAAGHVSEARRVRAAIHEDMPSLDTEAGALDDALGAAP